METECNGMLPFLGIQLLNRSPQIETKVYVKPTNSGLLLHYQTIGKDKEVEFRFFFRCVFRRFYPLQPSWDFFPVLKISFKTEHIYTVEPLIN